MNTEERFERIEHITAGLVEQRQRDREEYKALWRDTQRQMYDFATGMNDLRRHVDELAVETRLRIEKLADESRELGERIDKMISGIGQLAAESRASDERLGERITQLAQQVAAKN